MSFTIQNLSGLEILDSRGRPTVQATCTLTSGAIGRVSVPSGASRGAGEALELRDGDPKRYRGLGCLRAVANIHGEIAAALNNCILADQAELDNLLTDLDGTPNKARWGANAILAVSLAFARACAVEQQIPLYRHLADTVGNAELRLPRPMINLFSGGKHAGGQVPIQDLLIIPRSPETMTEVMRMAVEVFACAAEIMAERYGMRLLTADEGGLAPPFPNLEAMFEDALAAIQRAGLRAGTAQNDDVALGIDAAASHFYAGGRYQLGSQSLDSDGMIDLLERWIGDYPLISIEDGLAEDDWAGWARLRAALGGRVMIIGDDLLCTDPVRVKRAAEAQAANALLLKVNQIGTLSEAWQAKQIAHGAGWRVVISARSGETEDDWLADLAVGWGGDMIKVGSVTQSERLAKYNRLLAIEAETQARLRSASLTY